MAKQSVLCVREKNVMIYCGLRLQMCHLSQDEKTNFCKITKEKITIKTLHLVG